MEISALRQQLTSALVDFAWEEWAQMGILAAPPPPRRWAQDPEALLLLTLEVGRDDPRLFDEVLDWLVRNEPLMSVRRLRTLCEDPEDKQLSAAAIDWVTRQRRPRTPDRVAASNDAGAKVLFRRADLPVLRPDPVFREHGLIRPPAERSGKSSEPDLRAPINFALRLRHLLGVGTRAEAVRYLVTADIESATAAEVAGSSGYAKRNVQEALASLQAAGVATVTASGGEHLFAVDRTRWAYLLDLEPNNIPVYRDWPAYLGALRQILRWLLRPELETLSDYLRASQAADLLDQVRPRLNRAGLLLPARRGGELAWSDLEDTIQSALIWLAPPSGAGPAAFDLVEDTQGRFGWRLMTRAGRIVAASAEPYTSPVAARTAIKRLQGSPLTFSLRVIGDSGVYRWNIVAENGRILGASAELFATPRDAERAGRDARDLILGAAPPSLTPTEVIGQQRRHVSFQPDGRWRVEDEGATHAASTHATQADAIRAAKQAASRLPGGRIVVVHGRDGRIRSSDVVSQKS